MSNIYEANLVHNKSKDLLVRFSGERLAESVVFAWTSRLSLGVADGQYQQ